MLAKRLTKGVNIIKNIMIFKSGTIKARGKNKAGMDINKRANVAKSI